MVTAMEDQQAATGPFLPLDGVRNARDAGGHFTRDGRLVRRLKLLRSAGLQDLTEHDRGVLAEIGLRTVIDLRSAGEIADAPDPLDDLGIRQFHFPPLLSLLDDIPGTMADLYLYMIDNGGQAFAASIRELAQSAALPALVHCTAGKDRTGLLVAMVLDLLGVDEETIVEDYLLSNLGLGITEDGPPTWHRIHRELLTDALAHLRDRHGDTAGYLKAHGLDDAVLDALRSALTV